MYKKYNVISDVYSFILDENKIYVHRAIAETLQELSLQGEIIWHSKEIGIWDYNIYQNNIIFNLQNINGIANDTYIYNKITKQNWFHKKIILSNIPNRNYYRNNILYSFDNKKAVLLDLSNGSIYAEIPFESRGVPTLITNTSFIEKKKSYIYIFSF